MLVALGDVGAWPGKEWQRWSMKEEEHGAWWTGSGPMPWWAHGLGVEAVSREEDKLRSGPKGSCWDWAPWTSGSPTLRPRPAPLASLGSCEKCGTGPSPGF